MTETDFVDDKDSPYIEHIGIKRRSGRYPWGSGDNPLQRSRDFKKYYEEMKASGLSESEITTALSEYANVHADGHHPITVKSPDLRAAIAISTDVIYADNVATANRLAETGMSNVAIAKEMGTRESTVRGWRKGALDIKEGSLQATAARLRAEVAEKTYLDVGAGTELWMGVTASKLRTAVAMLRDEGYEVHPMPVNQLGTDKQTKLKILCPPGTPWKEAYAAKQRGDVQNVTAHSDDGGLSYRVPSHELVPVSTRNIAVRWKEDGGAMMDGVIEVRRGLPELSLGDSRYAQVRVAVGEKSGVPTHYLKGMAMYADDLPPGVNIRFNSAKTKAEAPTKLDTMKELKKDADDNIESDPRRAFGATVRPHVYLDKNGKEKTSPLNIVNEEGRWDEWSKSLSSQMLSKQSIALASQQLRKTQVKREDELKRINALTNPVVKQKLLDEFADSADAAAVHLKAAALDRQSSHVILPINSVRPTEVYAPNYETGERVVLIRYPHGGPFEIPELTVNNSNAAAKRILGGARDAIGIHHSVADQLSGADFDGDSVLVIPNPTRKIKTRPPLKELQGFDPKTVYKIPDGDTVTPRLKKKNVQREMGGISNLITDMTIHKASDAEIARAVKHSMVVIDAEKHGLNYKKSYEDNNIAQLKHDYQGGPRAGAATIISRASARKPVDKFKESVDPVTGRIVRTPTGEQMTRTKVNKRTGEVVEVVKPVQKRVERMALTDDARTLVSDHPQPIENLYANHANTMKALANRARLDSLAIPMPHISKTAKAIYSKQVDELNAMLKIAQRNAPVERRAQILGNAIAKARIDANPNFDADDIKKIKYQSLEEARHRTGADKVKIGSDRSPLTDLHWEAIQSGAIPSTTLRAILANADMERIRTLATPRPRTSVSTGQLARARMMAASGRSLTDIAATLGIPRSTLIDNLNSG